MKVVIYVWNKYDIAKTYAKKINYYSFQQIHKYTSTGAWTTSSYFLQQQQPCFLIKWTLPWITWQVSGTMATRAFGPFWSFFWYFVCLALPCQVQYQICTPTFGSHITCFSLLRPACDLFSFLFLLSHSALCIAFSSSRLFAENLQKRVSTWYKERSNTHSSTS